MLNPPTKARQNLPRKAKAPLPLNSPPAKKARVADDNALCVICYDKLNLKRSCSFRPCGHEYHVTCAVTLVETGESDDFTCPCCRSEVARFDSGKHKIHRIFRYNDSTPQPSIALLWSLAREGELEDIEEVIDDISECTQKDIKRVTAERKAAQRVKRASEWMEDIEEESAKLEKRADILSQMEECLDLEKHVFGTKDHFKRGPWNFDEVIARAKRSIDSKIKKYSEMRERAERIGKKEPTETANVLSAPAAPGPAQNANTFGTPQEIRHACARRPARLPYSSPAAREAREARARNALARTGAAQAAQTNNQQSPSSSWVGGLFRRILGFTS